MKRKRNVVDNESNNCMWVYIYNTYKFRGHLQIISIIAKRKKKFERREKKKSLVQQFEDYSRSRF